MKLVPGTRIGPYEIVAALGAGGMGEVYRARDARLQRDVAIKILPAGFASDADRRARFEREAQAVAALSHPNVLAIHDVGLHDGELYVVTELLDGETLAERLKAGALPIRKALDVAVQISHGLAAAHEKHIVHRDLKPENVFLVRDGRVKILDFGLARYTPSAAGASETVPAVSDPGVAMGTVGYMAPEQVRGQAVDERADLFAFGAVLYEMLTGQRAFRRDTAAETMTAILREDPPEAPLARANLSPALDRIVRHCLEKEPSHRFQTARDVGFAIESLSGTGSAAPPSSDRIASPAGQSRSPLPILIAAAVIAIGMVVAWLVWSRRDTVSTDSVPITLGTATQVTAEQGLEIDPAISPDGRFIAYSAGSAGQMRIFIRPVTGGRTLPLTDDKTAFEYQPRYSPDGSQILYLTGSGAFVGSALGGTPRRVAAGSIQSVAWAPDGKRVVLVRNLEMAVASIDGAAERPLAGPFEPHSCAWSPGDRWIACVSGNRFGNIPGRTFGNIAPSAIVLVSLTGDPAVEVAPATSLNMSPIWSTDGRTLYFVSNRRGPHDIFAVEVGPDGRPLAEPVRVTTGLGVQSITMTADGRRIAYSTYTARANLWTLPIPTRGPVDTSAARALTSDNQIIEAAAVSPDRRWLVFDSDRYRNGDIFRMPVGGGPVERLTTDPANEFAPDVSPDGRELAFHSFQSGTRDVFIKPIDGNAAAERITFTTGQESYPSWSPDGTSIAYIDQALQAGQALGLHVTRRAAGRWSAPVFLRAGTLFKPAWVADGRSIVYAQQRGGIEAIDVESRAVRVLYVPSSPGDPFPGSAQVSEDGRTVYFKSHDAEQRASFWSIPITGGRPTQLVRFTDPTRESIRRDFAIGGGQFFFTLEDRQSDIWVADVLSPRK